jgi:hypothetical protein
LKTQAGLWIDHRKAVIVMVSESGEEVKEISSNIPKHVRFTSRKRYEEGSSEDVRERQFENRLNSYYDSVIALLRDADTLQIYGPGEAKVELEKRIQHAGLKAQLLAVESTDKLTVRQVAAKVRLRLQV